MASSLSTQMKARIQQLGSPKLKVSTNNVSANGAIGNMSNMNNPNMVPTYGQNTGQNLKPQMQKIFSRADGNNQSQSPDDQGTSRGVLQRIQMKNLAFIPAKGQSPMNLHYNITNQNQGSPNESMNNNIQKISPQRIIGIGNKVVIPANQIRLVKKDGTSPSPEARQPTLKQLSPTSVNFVMQSNLQNKNPNALNLGDQSLNINNQNKSSKNLMALITQQSQHQNSQNNQAHGYTHSNLNEKQQNLLHNNAVYPASHLSDDETNVNSDGEDNNIIVNTQRSSAAISLMKSDQSNNFNRPKINTMQQQSHQNIANNATFVDQTLASQRTQRGSYQQPHHSNHNNNNNNGNTSNGLQDKNLIKVISQHKIRQSPSPPPNQVFKNNNQAPVVTNIQNIIKNQQQQQQQQQHQSHHYNNHHTTNNSNQYQSSQQLHFNQAHHNPHQPISDSYTNQNQSQLASDFIKGMINQNKNANNQSQVSNGPGNLVQKKTLGSGLQNVLKKNTLGQQQQQQQQSSTNFHKDMKKHGIAKDMQDVGQFTSVMSECSPPRLDESKQLNQQISQPQKLIPQKLQVSKISHIRNYSPPPNFDQVGLTGLNEIKDLSKVTTKPTDSSPTNMSTQQEEQNQTTQGNNGEQGSVFQFPFQRRARSLSIPKQEMIQNKMQQQNAAANGTQAQADGKQDPDKTSQSPNRPIQEQEQKGRNKPVVAKLNFVIAQKGGVILKEDEDAVFERQKEVDEWLMGSGESDATAASNTSNNALMNGSINGKLQGVQNNLSTFNKLSAKHTHKKSLTEFDKPVQPDIHNDDDDNDSVGQGDDAEEEDWMFRTFDKVKANKTKGGNQQKATNNVNQENNVNNVMQSRRLESNRDFDLEGAFEDPFELAPEMQKQFMKPKPQDLDPFMCDLNNDNKILGSGEQLKISNNKQTKNNEMKNMCSFMDQIDDFMESGFL